VYDVVVRSSRSLSADEFLASSGPVGHLIKKDNTVLNTGLNTGVSTRVNIGVDIGVNTGLKMHWIT